MKRLKRIGWVVGYLVAAALLMLFTRTIDLGPLKSFTPAIWFKGIGGVFVLQLLIIALHSLHWGLLLSCAGIRVPIRRIYAARLAGAAVSILSPSLSIGGEVVRTALVKESKVPTSRLAATVAIDKYVELATRLPFVAAGLCVLFGRGASRNPLILEAGLAFTLVILAVSVFLTTLLLRKSEYRRRGERKIGGFDHVLDRIRPGAAKRLRSSLEEFAGSLARMRPNVLLPAFAVGLLASSTELLQILFALNFLGVQGAGSALAVQSASILGGIVGFLPANIGGMEATNLLSITLVGGSAVMALAFSLILRGGQVGTVLCGLIYLAARRVHALRQTREAAAPQGQCCSSE